MTALIDALPPAVDPEAQDPDGDRPSDPEPQPQPEPRRGARVAIWLLVAGLGLGLFVFVAFQGWRGPRTQTADGTPTDDFDGPVDEGGMGTTDDGRQWSVPIGPWAKDDGQARPVDDGAATRWIATVDNDSTEGVVGTTLETPQAGAGVLFRYRDPENYWSLTAVPDAKSWLVQRIEGGLVAFEQQIAFALADPGVVVEVRYDDEWIDLRLDDVRIAGLYDPSLGDATGVGIIAGGLAGPNTRFDDFYALTGD